MIRIFSDLRCVEHAVPPGMPEVPRRVVDLLDRLESSDWECVVGAEHPGWREAVEAVHDPAYVTRLELAVARGDGLLDSADTPLSEGTLPAAQAAVEATLAAVEWMMDGVDRQPFVAVRPPGHHAEDSMAMGFCYFNNVAIAAAHLLERCGVGRVAIVDFDVHHGNGTQHLFESSPSVLYASLHQHPLYPGTGLSHETGRDAGEGATLNIPLPAGSTDGDYEEAFTERLLPGLVDFEPEVLLVSAGFDAWAGDPLGGMQVSRTGYGRWGERLGEVAAELCDGRALSVLEGGYDLEALPGLCVSYLEGLAAG